MKQYKRQADIEYLTNHYKTATKQLMERGFSNYMVVGFYKCTLDNNAAADNPKDLSELEELLCKYVSKNS